MIADIGTAEAGMGPAIESGMAPDALHRIFPLGTNVSELPSIIEGNREYVPFTSVKITEELAAHRRALNAGWSEKSCTPGIHVTYRPANSMGVRALGRL